MNCFDLDLGLMAEDRDLKTAAHEFGAWGHFGLTLAMNTSLDAAVAVDGPRKLIDKLTTLCSGCTNSGGGGTAIAGGQFIAQTYSRA